MIDVIVSDLNMPGAGGLELLDRVRAINPEIPIVVVTAFGTVASAVEAMKRGAADYLTKPIDLGELEVLIDRTLERRALVSENRQLRQALESRYRLEGLETLNARMEETISLAARAAGSLASVLILGESGTGKEVLARAIHHAGERSRGPLVAVNIAALAETLVESELFGHERGAFTGSRPRTARPVRAGTRGHAVPRRNRRPAEVGAAEAPASASGAELRTGGRHTHDPGGRPDHRRHQSAARRARGRLAHSGRTSITG